MQLGCGVRTMTVKGRDYLYVWHYESRDGRRRAVHDYIGPARDPDAARKGIEDARRRLQARKAGAIAASR